jgi:hypothetical protein
MQSDGKVIGGNATLALHTSADSFDRSIVAMAGTAYASSFVGVYQPYFIDYVVEIALQEDGCLNEKDWLVVVALTPAAYIFGYIGMDDCVELL